MKYVWEEGTRRGRKGRARQEGRGHGRKGGDMAEMDGILKNGRNRENKGNKYLPLSWLNPHPYQWVGALHCVV